MEEARTKIIATVGPACEDAAVLEAMMRAGADAFRVNGAHVDEAGIGAWVERVRTAGRSAGRSPAVLVDLPGTKIRLGELDGGRPLELAVGTEVDIDADPAPGTARRLPLESVRFFEEVPVGAYVLLGEGQARLEVLEARHDLLRTRVADAGTVRPGMGVHFPGVSLPSAVPTERDRELLRAAVRAGADIVCQSFVHTVDDIGRLKELLVDLGARQVPVVAKIERRQAVENLDRILSRADGAIVARGDLGLDAGPENVPSLQRRILEAARRWGRPAIVATEMLESMTTSTRPTRAEASDVAGAVFEGADAVMLSAETAIGQHPALVVTTMSQILVAAEADPTAPYAGSALIAPPSRHAGRPDQHVVRAAVALADETGARAIVVFTRTGMSAVRLSKERPLATIHAFAPDDAVCRRLAYAWGVRAERLPQADGTDALIAAVVERLREAGDLAPGERAVLVMGGTRDPAGATTLIKLITG